MRKLFIFLFIVTTNFDAICQNTLFEFPQFENTSIEQIFKTENDDFIVSTISRLLPERNLHKIDSSGNILITKSFPNNQIFPAINTHFIELSEDSLIYSNGFVVYLFDQNLEKLDSFPLSTSHEIGGFRLSNDEKHLLISTTTNTEISPQVLKLDLELDPVWITDLPDVRGSSLLELEDNSILVVSADINNDATLFLLEEDGNIKTTIPLNVQLNRLDIHLEQTHSNRFITGIDRVNESLLSFDTTGDVQFLNLLPDEFNFAKYLRTEDDREFILGMNNFDDYVVYEINDNLEKISEIRNVFHTPFLVDSVFNIGFSTRPVFVSGNEVFHTGNYISRSTALRFPFVSKINLPSVNQTSMVFGKITKDRNDNCQAESNENGIRNIFITSLETQETRVSNEGGYLEFYVNEGENRFIIEENSSWETCIDTISVSVGLNDSTSFRTPLQSLDCLSDAGHYPPDDLFICSNATGGGLFTAPLPTNLFLDANDGIDYIQFTDPLDPFNSFVRSSVGSTTEPTDILVSPATGTNSIYFAAVVADRKPDGRLDLDDPCLSISTSFKININDLTCSIDAEIRNGCFTTQSKLVANASGGTPPYEYLWSTGSTEDSIAIFGVGVFLVTITDALNCTSRCLVTLPDPLPFEVQVNDFCGGDSIPMFIQGIPPFNGYVIPTTDLGILDTIFYNDLLVQLNPLSPEILSFDYNFIDDLGCTTEGTIDSLPTEPLDCQFNFSSDTLSCINSVIEITSNCTGGTPPYSILWTNASTTILSPNLIIDQPGTYNVSVSDAMNCTLTRTFVIEYDDSDCGSIIGTVLLDQEDDCLFTSTDTPLDCWIVQASNTNHTFFATTQPDGSYILPVAPGSYNLELLSPNPLYGICNNNQQITVVDANDVVNADFLVNVLFECPLMEVSVGSFIPRRCFSGSMPIEYCNNGTIAADDVSIELILDPLIEINNASLPFTTNGDTLIFEIGTVEPFDCGWFFIEYKISCNAVLNQTLCAEAIIFPNDPCPAPDSLWSGASLRINGECTGDSIHFTIKNVGTGTMIQAREYIVIEDAAIMRISNPFTLGPGGETKGSIPTTGSTIRIEVPQEANHPGESMPSITIEHCGTGPFSSGFVTQLPLDDADTFIDIQCEEVRGSFDPNDKRAEPKGFDSEHFIEPNTDLEYTIRFQNTGNDTAFTVEIIDTLSNLLDVGSVNPGVSSHDYRFEVFETGILRFKFNDILLVDSFTNEPASNGFVKYSIAQKEDVPLGSVIYNAADIYFDFNDPIHTNQTFHTVGRDFITVKTQEVFVPGATVNVYPNPFNDRATFELKNVAEGQKTLRLLDISGRVIYSQTVNNEQLILERNNLNSGFYFYEILGEGAKIAVGKLIIE